MLGKQWKSEPEHVKGHFRGLASDIKRKHAEDHPDYQYTPRKQSEKKRRSSRRSSNHNQNADYQSQHHVILPVSSEQLSAIAHEASVTTPSADTPKDYADNGSIEFSLDEIQEMNDAAEAAGDWAAFHQEFRIFSPESVSMLDLVDFIAEQ
jgi:hypothetical protein